MDEGEGEGECVGREGGSGVGVRDGGEEGEREREGEGGRGEREMDSDGGRRDGGFGGDVGKLRKRKGGVWGPDMEGG